MSSIYRTLHSEIQMPKADILEEGGKVSSDEPSYGNQNTASFFAFYFKGVWPMRFMLFGCQNSFHFVTVEWYKSSKANKHFKFTINFYHFRCLGHEFRMYGIADKIFESNMSPLSNSMWPILIFQWAGLGREIIALLIKLFCIRENHKNLCKRSKLINCAGRISLKG